jgi:integrase
MSVKLIRRGEVYHLSGTIRVGKKSVRVRETTGCHDEESAQIELVKRSAEITTQLLRGEDPGRAKAIPGFATAAADYQEANEKDGKRLGNQDRRKLLRLGEYFGEKPVDEFEPEDWDRFVEDELDDPAPGTVRRWFSMFSPPMVRTAAKFKFTLPEFVLPSEGPIREIFLEPEDRDRLLAAYADHARRVARMLCYQGCRHFEALRLEWPNVSLSRDTLTFRVTKNGESRTVPLHPEIRANLGDMHRGQMSGRVFLTPDGKPYVDRRAASHGDGTDGSGIRTAHRTAVRRFTIKKLMKEQRSCRHCGGALIEEPGHDLSAVVELAVTRPAGEREQLGDYALSCSECHAKNGSCAAAKINWFRLHDWRHHWASWAAMDGCDAPTLMALGGWKSPKMVQRYVKLDVRHLAKKLAQSQRS